VPVGPLRGRARTEERSVKKGEKDPPLKGIFQTYWEGKKMGGATVIGGTAERTMKKGKRTKEGRRRKSPRRKQSQATGWVRCYEDSNRKGEKSVI